MISRVIAIIIGLALTDCSFNPTNPCSSIIKGNKEQFSTNEPIHISYSIRNVSKDTVRIWHCGFWCNNKIVVTDSNGIELARTEWGKSGLSAFSPGGARDKNSPLQLAPGEVDSTYEKYDLRSLFLFSKTGRYNVKYIYHEIDGKATTKIESNTLKIKIDDQ